MKAGFTIDTCPGCGEKKERKKNSVCPECIGLIATAKDHKKMYEEFKLKGENIECNVPFGWDGPTFYSSRQILTSEHTETLKKAFIYLSQLVSVPEGMSVNYGYMQYLENRASIDYSKSIYISDRLPTVFIRDKKLSGKNNFNGQGTAIMPREIYECLCDLSSLVADALQTTEDKALELGKKSLFLLNAGKLTMDEFDRI